MGHTITTITNSGSAHGSGSGLRFRTQTFKRNTTWIRSCALICLEGTVRMFLFQAAFTKIDVHRSGVRPAPTGTKEKQYPVELR